MATIVESGVLAKNLILLILYLPEVLLKFTGFCQSDYYFSTLLCGLSTFLFKSAAILWRLHTSSVLGLQDQVRSSDGLSEPIC
jgi:hypothetical protein